MQILIQIIIKYFLIYKFGYSFGRIKRDKLIYKIYSASFHIAFSAMIFDKSILDFLSQYFTHAKFNNK